MSTDADFARPFTLAEAKRQAGCITLSADAEEREALARRFGLLALDALDATLSLTVEGDELHVAGHVTARATQACIASGEPVPEKIDEAIAIRFVPSARLEAAEEEAEIELDGASLDVIGYDGGAIDLGAMVADTLALALDPYPRSKDADAWLKAHGVKSEEEAGAFGALAALKDKLTK